MKATRMEYGYLYASCVLTWRRVGYTEYIAIVEGQREEGRRQNWQGAGQRTQARRERERERSAAFGECKWLEARDGIAKWSANANDARGSEERKTLGISGERRDVRVVQRGAHSRASGKGVELRVARGRGVCDSAFTARRAQSRSSSSASSCCTPRPRAPTRGPTAPSPAAPSRRRPASSWSRPSTPRTPFSASPSRPLEPCEQFSRTILAQATITLAVHLKKSGCERGVKGGEDNKLTNGLVQVNEMKNRSIDHSGWTEHSPYVEWYTRIRKPIENELTRKPHEVFNEIINNSYIFLTKG